MQNLLNVSRATWSNYENGLTEPSLNKIIEIASFFNIRLDHLLLKDLSSDHHTVSTTSSYKPEHTDNLLITNSSLAFQENDELTLWNLFKEIKELRKELDDLKKERG